MNKTLKSLEDYISVKSEPEIRHIFAHLMFAIECLIKNCPNGAMDNIKSVEGLIMFDGDDPEDWERYYQNVIKKGVIKSGVSRKKEKRIKKRKEVQNPLQRKDRD